MSFPAQRPRRLRLSPGLRALVRETELVPRDFILPLFVSATVQGRAAVPALPGVFQWDSTSVAGEAQAAAEAGLAAVLLFGVPKEKDEQGKAAYADDGVVQQAVRNIKRHCPGLVVITDVCLCEYTSHGHCGIVRRDGSNFSVLNDETVEVLGRIAVSHAKAGADIVAPSDMMDGRVTAIRHALDANGFSEISILSYAVKFASVLYGPFREAAGCAPQFGDRRSYQLDPANSSEALHEVALDLEEGADMILIKPALTNLDILWRVKERFGRPTGAYHVSGEYAMVKTAAERGVLDEQAAALEIMTSIKRAGADFIVTYWAQELAKWSKA